MGPKHVTPCLVDHLRSPTFVFLLDKFKKVFPHIEDDLAAALSDIRLDYRTAKHATALLHFGGKVLKYRMACSDQGRGTRGGFRLIVYYHQETNTLYPISMYPKSEREDIADADVERCVNELQEALANSS